MGKKILPKIGEGEVRLYPKNAGERTLEVTWEVKWRWMGVRRHLNVPNKKTVEEREMAAKELIARIIANPANPCVKKVTPVATAQTDQLFKSITLRGKMKGLELKTVQSYESHVRNLDAFCKREGFRSVSKEAAKAFVSYLIDNNYHPTTINAHKVTFNIFFNVLKKEKVVRQNPFSDIERVEGASEVRSHFTVGQLELVKKTLIDKDLQHIEIACQYLYYLLCRPKELRLLKISNVNFQDWSIKISWRVGKKKKARFAIVPDGLKAWMIDNKISEYPLGHYLISKSGLPGEAPVGINFWSSKFTEILRGLGFDESYVLYSIKNTGAITWYKALRDIIAVQRQIGHEDTKTTQIYLRSLGVSDFDYVRPLIPLF